MKYLLILLAVAIPIGLTAQWDVIHKGSESGGENDLYFLNSDSGFVIGGNPNGSFVLRTHDGGVSWDSLWYDSHQFSSIYFSSPDTGYIGCFYQNQIAVMRTINAGASWQRVASNLASAVSVPYALS